MRSWLRLPAPVTALLRNCSAQVRGRSTRAVRVSVPAMGKKMLSLTVNAAAEKMIRQELQRLGAPARFLVSPAQERRLAEVAPPVAPVGSVQEAALAHPLVQRAQEIFKAEVRSVVDLRQK